MKCKKCGKVMVVENLSWINASNPPSVWMICKCGHRDLKIIGDAIIFPKTWEERWDEENK